MQTLGDRLKYLRETKGLSQQQLADAVRTSRSHISSVETNFRYPSDILVSALCTFFSVREQWLRSGELPIKHSLESAVKDELSQFYFSIAAELAPSVESPEAFLALLQRIPEYNRIVNYLNHRLLLETDQNAPRRLSALFSVAFPDYIEVTDRLFSNVSEEKKEQIRSPLLLRSATIRPAGRAAAGMPVFDSNSDEITIAIPEKFLDTRRFKYIEVKGDSMEPRILSGDYVVVAVDVLPEPGEIALFYMNDHLSEDGYVIKRYQRSNGAIHLISLNPNYPPIELLPKQIHKMEKIVYVAHAGR